MTKTLDEIGNYDWALPCVDQYMQSHNKKIELIAEIGSRDALDGIALARRYKANVIVFEPDPYNIPGCQKNIETSNLQLRGGGVELYEMALSNKTGLVDWHSVDPEIYDNPGASGLYLINFRNRRLGDPDRNRSKIQTLRTIKASRFDDLDLPVPNLNAMDVQGAELAVLQGFGAQLQDVSAIILETCFSENYIGGSKFKDIDLWLTNENFSFQQSTLSKNPFRKPKITLPARFGFYSQDFNVLYTKNN